MLRGSDQIKDMLMVFSCRIRLTVGVKVVIYEVGINVCGLFGLLRQVCALNTIPDDIKAGSAKFGIQIYGLFDIVFGNGKETTRKPSRIAQESAPLISADWL